MVFTIVRGSEKADARRLNIRKTVLLFISFTAILIWFQAQSARITLPKSKCRFLGQTRFEKLVLVLVLILASVTVLRTLIQIIHDSVSLEPINSVIRIPLQFLYNFIRVLVDTSSLRCPNAPRDGLGLFIFWPHMKIEISGYDIGSR